MESRSRINSFDDTSKNPAHYSGSLSDLLIAQDEERAEQLMKIAAPSEDGSINNDPEALGALVATLNMLSKQEYKIVDELLADFHSCREEDERSMIRLELDRYLGNRTVIRPDEAEMLVDDFDHSAHAIHREKVGERILKMRQQKYWNQTTLAERTRDTSPPGLSQSHISLLESGKYTPTYITIEKLAKAFGCKMSDLDPSYDD